MIYLANLKTSASTFLNGKEYVCFLVIPQPSAIQRVARSISRIIQVKLYKRTYTGTRNSNTNIKRGKTTSKEKDRDMDRQAGADKPEQSKRRLVVNYISSLVLKNSGY